MAASDLRLRDRAEVATSLIISSRQRHALLECVVASVMAGTTLPDELIVVDQSEVESDELSNVARRFPSWLRYIVSDERGLSRGRISGSLSHVGGGSSSSMMMSSSQPSGSNAFRIPLRRRSLGRS